MYRTSNRNNRRYLSMKYEPEYEEIVEHDTVIVDGKELTADDAEIRQQQ